MERIEEIKEDFGLDEDKIEQLNKPLTKGELRKKLKHRIKSAKGGRQVGLNRKKTENIQDSLSKVSELLQNKGIDNPSKIDEQILKTQTILKSFKTNTLSSTLAANAINKYL